MAGYILSVGILFLSLTLPAFCFRSLRRKDVHGMLGEPPLPPTNTELPPDNWFVQLLDHFEPTNTNTWKQRYQVVEDHYREGGPVFLMIGGEGEASAKWMLSGEWVDNAIKYNALIFQLEHRYYGKSHPTSDLSVENLRYLSSEQALADLAYFIVAMNSKYNLPEGTKWIAFGGSYPGNLAAWVRYKYPHLIHAAVAASGPVLAKLDFPEYMDVVRDSLGTYSSMCVEAVATADRHVNLLLKHPLGLKEIEKEFKLCNTLDANNAKDVANLLEALAGNFAEIVQYNKDNRESNSTSKRITIDTLCDIMMDEKRGTPVHRYAEVNSLLLEKQGEKCLDHEYSKMVEEIRNTTWGATNGARQWMYQTCTEFGFYQSSEDRKQLFGTDFPLDFFIQQCGDIFDKKFNKDFITQAVARSNALYGGRSLTATRVVYVHGSIDPWHVLGITKTIIPESPAIFIEGTAHCANMYPSSESDLPALKAARRQISSLIWKWLQES